MKRLLNTLSRLWTTYRVLDFLHSGWEFIRDNIDGF